MLDHAFKEWAVICAALAQGKQALILRKGGIAEEAGEFRVEQPRFWLYPTYLHQHQHRDTLKPEAETLLEEVERNQPPAGIVRLSHWCETTGVYHVRDEITAQMVHHLHFWSEETVRKRFVYRTPGLYVLAVRVFAAPSVVAVTETPEYHGCKSWVHLDHALATVGSTPVLADERYENIVRQLDLLLQPTALA